jgi:hypothetical protein
VDAFRGGKMKCIKFVTDNFESPGIKGKLDYSNFGKIIEVENYDPPEKGQCGAGIHVIPLTDNMNFHNCIFSDKCIVLEAHEKYIIWQENNQKMRVRKVIPLYELTSETKEWEYILKNPRFAWYYAVYVDKCASDDTRKGTLSDPDFAFYYAKYIDKKPRDNTRNAVLSSLWCAYHYALEIDKIPRDDTRNAVLMDPYYAYKYACNIDKCPRDDTREACGDVPEYKGKYQIFEEKFPQ